MTKTTITSHHPLVFTVLQQVSTDRLHRAVNALAEGTMTITLTWHSEAEIRALVKNGEGIEYGVTLTDALTTCSCKDSLYRGVVCKHAVALALHVIRAPQALRTEEELREQQEEWAYNLKLVKTRPGWTHPA